jgi:hypothetical protein
LRRGDFTEITSPEPVFSFVRSYATETIVVILNTSENRRDVSLGIGSGRPWRDLLLHDMIRDRTVKRKGSPEPLGIEPFGALILNVE